MTKERITAPLIVLDAAALISASLLVFIFSTGGIELRWHGLVLRATDVWRPGAVLAGALAVRVWLLRRTSAQWIRLSVERTAAGTLLTLIVGSCLIDANYRVRVCGGLDSQGYVTASALIASGRLTEDQPIASLLPFEGAAEAATPLGYVVAPDGHSRAPRFPLGLPLAMAAFRIVGPEGPFLVPLACGIGLLIVVFLIARESASATGSLFAAALVALSPTVVSGIVQPMSDVPAAFWLTLAVWLAFRKSPSFVAAGLAAGMAVLTRPVLLPAVVTIAAAAVWQSRAAVRFAIVALSVVLVQVAINRVLYGGAIGSGYGSSNELFQLSRLSSNVVNIGKWTMVTHTPLVWPAWIAALVVLRRRRQPWLLSVVAVAAILPYLLYLTYDDWESTRFIVGAIVLMLVVIAQGIDALAARILRPPFHAALLATVAVACGLGSSRFLHGSYIFDAWRAAQKYALVGSWLRANTPERTVVLSSLHSGSIRYYGDRETVRWDRVPAGSLPSTISSLSGHGHRVYAALDMPTEADPFNARFRNDLPRVAMLPAGGVREVTFYELKLARE